MKIVINPDKERVKTIRAAIQENNGYCPCAIVKTQDTKCLCRNFREEIEEGYCHCGLYQKVK